MEKQNLVDWIPQNLWNKDVLQPESHSSSGKGASGIEKGSVYRVARPVVTPLSVYLNPG